MEKTSSFTSFLSKRDKLRFFWRRVQLFSPFWFSHHPQCNNFSSEVIKVGRYRFCRGCAIVYFSTLITSIFTVFFQVFHDFPFENLVFLVIIISSPTWIGVISSFKRRWVKDLIRASLGIGWGIALGSLFVRTSLVEKLLIVIAMIVFYQLFKVVRRLKHQHVNDLLCPNCKQLSEEACEGTRQLLDAERTYSRELSDFLQEKIRKSKRVSQFLSSYKEKEITREG